MLTTEEYRLLFNTITDTLRRLEALAETLRAAQREAEEIVISKAE